MKTTLLSWCGKAGVPKEFRLTLGGHSKGKTCMGDLYSRDELAEPLRRLGFVMAWVIERRFLPDSTKSGRWHSTEANYENPEGKPLVSSSRQAEADACKQAMAAQQKTKKWSLEPKSPDEVLAELELPIETAELPDSDVEELDNEDDERDALQERSAEVLVDTEYPEPVKKPANTLSKVVFAPRMPHLEFSVIRHLFRGTRHWCTKGNHVICQEGLLPQYDKTKYWPAVTHDDAFCLDCLRAASEDYQVEAPERFVHGTVETTHLPCSADSETAQGAVAY